MKRWIASLVVALTLVLVLVACGTTSGTNIGGSSSPAVTPSMSQSESSVEDPIEVIWWNTLDTQGDEVLEEIVANFNASHPDIVVKMEFIGNWNELNETIVAANAANSGLPGIALCNTKFIAAYAENGLFEDLNSYIQRDNYDTSDFVSTILSTGSFDGRQIAFPFLNNTQVIYFNKTLASEYGWSVPTEFSKWDGFFEQVKTAGYTPLSMQSLDFYYGCIYRSHGVELLSFDGHCNMNTPAALAVTNQFVEWCNNGSVQWLQGTDASANMRQSFYDQNTFMVFHNSSALPDYIDNCDFEVGIAWYPSVDGTNIADLGGSVIGIPSRNPQEVKDAAWEFIKYIESEEIHTPLALEGGCIPYHYSALESNAIEDYLQTYPAYQTLFNHLDNIYPPFLNRSASEIVKIWQNYTNQIMLDGAEPQATSDQMVAEIDAITTE